MIKTVCDFCGKTLKSEKANQTIGSVWTTADNSSTITTFSPTFEGLDMCGQCYKDAKRRKAK